MSSQRELYRPSGRVAWIRMAIWFALTVPITLISGYLLSTAFRSGIYMIILAPAFCMVPAVGGLLLTIWLGHCRNGWLGGFAGVVTGILALASSFQIDHAREVGSGLFHGLDQLPHYAVERIKTDVVGEYGIRRRAAAGDAGEWPYFLLDALVVLSIPAAFSWVRARKPYSEKHQAWFYGHT